MRHKRGLHLHHVAGLPAFTLVELLVVIGIISVLIALLLPGLAAARNAALQVACSANLKQIALGMQIYADQHKGKLPPYYRAGVGSGGYGFWSDHLIAANCVGPVTLYKLDNGNSYPAAPRNIFQCPSAPEDFTDRNYLNYGINHSASEAKMHHLKQPYLTFAVMDAHGTSVYPNHPEFAAPRHGAKANSHINILYFDWRVEALYALNPGYEGNIIDLPPRNGNPGFWDNSW